MTRTTAPGVVLLAILALLGSGPVRAADPKPLTFAPLPMEQPDTVVRQVKPMLDHLEQAVGASIRIDYSTDYAEILRKFREGKVDLAYLGPLPYVALREAYRDAVPVVHFREKSGDATYTCCLVVGPGAARDVPLAGKRIALTQPLSTCGFLSTDALLQARKVDLEQARYRYLDKHDEVAQAVARGDFEAGGLKTAIARKYEPLGIQIVAETAPLPGFALIANARTVPPDRIAALQQALVRLDPKAVPEHAELVRTWGESLRYGAVEARDTDYDAVRRMRRGTEIPAKGNF